MSIVSDNLDSSVDAQTVYTLQTLQPTVNTVIINELPNSLDKILDTHCQLNTKLVAQISQQILAIYQDRDFYLLFGADTVNYLCELATRYACWSIPSKYLVLDISAVEGYALWLSIVWLIDGLCDKYRTLITIRDVQVLTAIMTGNIYDNPATAVCPPILQSLYEMTTIVYQRYLLLTSACRQRNATAFTQINYWLRRYCNTLLDDNQRTFTLSGYQRWRLDSGAMMCVIWHLLLFDTSTGDYLNDANISEIFEIVALLVSYHNDIVSLHRDIQQDTPNLVSVINNNDYWTASKLALQILDTMYQRLLDKIKAISNSTIADICYNVINGSYHWTHLEPRYAKGVSMIQLIRDEQRVTFLAQLFEHTEVPGDPNFLT